MMPRLCCLLAGLWLVACTTDQTALPTVPAAPAAQPAMQPTASAPSMDPIAGASAFTQDGSSTSIRTPQSGLDGGTLQNPVESRQQNPAARPEPAPNKKPAPALDPEKLVGMDHGELRDLLGKPSLLRGERDAQVWQYGGTACVLHVFLYRDGANGRYRVAYVDTVSRQRSAAIQADEASFQRTCLGPLPQRATAQNQPS